MTIDRPLWLSTIPDNPHYSVLASSRAARAHRRRSRPSTDLTKMARKTRGAVDVLIRNRVCRSSREFVVGEKEDKVSASKGQYIHDILGLFLSTFQCTDAHQLLLWRLEVFRIAFNAKCNVHEQLDTLMDERDHSMPIVVGITADARQHGRGTGVRTIQLRVPCVQGPAGSAHREWVLLQRCRAGASLSMHHGPSRMLVCAGLVTSTRRNSIFGFFSVRILTWLTSQSTTSPFPCSCAAWVDRYGELSAKIFRVIITAVPRS